jgi:low temperature requirement protein LtrA
VQACWILPLFAPQAWPVAFPTFVAFELIVPAWAERLSMTTWHPHHIAERYGLLTLIVLGESILSATGAVQSALAAGDRLSALVPVIAGGLLVVYSLWWIYFDRPAHDLLTSYRRAFFWGYGHYFVYAAAAAVGAGLGVAVDRAGGHAALGAVGAGLAVAVPVAIFLVSLWILLDRPEYGWTRSLGPIAAAIVLLTALTAQPVLWTGVTLASLVAVKLVVHRGARA